MKNGNTPTTKSSEDELVQLSVLFGRSGLVLVLLDDFILEGLMLALRMTCRFGSRISGTKLHDGWTEHTKQDAQRATKKEDDDKNNKRRRGTVLSSISFSLHIL